MESLKPRSLNVPPPISTLRAMPEPSAESTMAVFLDLENLVLGARDAHYPNFDVQKVLGKLLLRGHIVVKKAYCDFERYRDFKRGLHEAAFELIEIPHVRQSGKNSADIRMVVDALDLCYTKQHVDTFVIMSGDSDFSPLVSKLRENAKTVIGVGVKNSTADLFITNCDTFFYYDDLVRAERTRSRPGTEVKKAQAKAREAQPADSATAAPPLEDALDLVVSTLEGLSDDRSDDARIFGSFIKQTIRRRNPGFNERAYGFRSFNDLLLEAQNRKLLELEPDEKSGGYIVLPLE